MSSGFQAAGFDVAFAGELWARARLVYDQNFDHASTALDLSEVVNAASVVSRVDAEIIVGGPPCQDFSAAGTRTEAGRADLTWHYAEVVRSCRPNWFVMENVPAAGGSRAWSVARSRLLKVGYGTTEVVLDASLFGVPQLRKRRFLIGRMGESENFLVDHLRDWQSEKSLTVREYLGDEFGLEHYYRHPRHWGRRAIYSIDEPAATIRSTNRPIAPKYKAHPLDSAPIAAARLLTPTQRARIQTFGRDHRFDKDLFQHEIDLMVANAVPVRLAECIANAISDFEESKYSASDDRDFRTWLRTERGYTHRTVGNVLSRVKRARRIIDDVSCSGNAEEVVALQRKKEFFALSSSVRSQLKKALILRWEFDHRA